MGKDRFVQSMTSYGCDSGRLWCCDGCVTCEGMSWSRTWYFNISCSLRVACNTWGQRSHRPTSVRRAARDAAHLLCDTGHLSHVVLCVLGRFSQHDEGRGHASQTPEGLHVFSHVTVAVWEERERRACEAQAHFLYDAFGYERAWYVVCGDGVLGLSVSAVESRFFSRAVDLL